MNLALYQIAETATLREAMVQIEANQLGLVLTINAGGIVTGVVTDGDLRRKLIDGGNLEDPVRSSANQDFVWADSKASRELLLKQLDGHIRVIPLLDHNHRLTGVISQDYFPNALEEPTYARSRAPVRISFGGGGSDLTHFFSGDNGAVINTTISFYSYATLRKRNDSEILIHSRDLSDSLRAANLTDALAYEGSFGLIQALLKAIRPDFGFELYLQSDFPMKSGLGGSAVVCAAILGCFNQFRLDRWDLHEIAEIAYQAERFHLGIAGGWQDQYATVFGGFNFMEFRMEQNLIHPLRIPLDVLCELEESLVLCDTSIEHDSGEIHKDQRAQMQQESVRKKVQSNVELTYRMRDHLLRGRLFQFGQTLHEAWMLKRQFSNKISSNRLDGIYSEALAHGAIGGKLLGAGGGGFFLFYVTPFRKHELINKLESMHLKVRPFKFEQDGLRAWSARERKSHLSLDT